MNKYIDDIISVAKGKKTQCKRWALFNADGEMIREFGNLSQSPFAIVIRDESNPNKNINIDGYITTLVVSERIALLMASEGG